MALSTSTSCQTSALQSLPFLLLRTNFAANSLPVVFSVHLLTTAYCPLKVNFVQINPKKRTDKYYLQRLDGQLTSRFRRKCRRNFQSPRCAVSAPFMRYQVSLELSTYHKLVSERRLPSSKSAYSKENRLVQKYLVQLTCHTRSVSENTRVLSAHLPN